GIRWTVGISVVIGLTVGISWPRPDANSESGNADPKPLRARRSHRSQCDSACDSDCDFSHSNLLMFARIIGERRPSRSVPRIQCWNWNNIEIYFISGTAECSVSTERGDFEADHDRHRDRTHHLSVTR